MKQNAFCPECGKDVPVLVETRQETYRVRGQDIEAPHLVSVCEVCGNEFATADQVDEGLKASYRIYRKKAGIMNPQDIVQLRKRYDASQKAFGLILGFGELTINTYEQGSLPSEAHHKLLEQARDPRWFGAQFAKARDALGRTQCKRIETALAEMPAQTAAPLRSLEYALQSDLGSMVGEAESEYSGWCKPRPHKLLALMREIVESIKAPVYKMRLLKLMFYADFAFFRASTHSISGWPYARLPYGPVPERYEEILCHAVRTGVLNSHPDEEEKGDILQPGPAGSDLRDALSPEEKEMIASVCGELGHLSATRLSELTHQEDAWLKTENAKKISYDHALTLKAIV